MINRRQFLYHCHILEHGDMGMMRNYLITKCCVPQVIYKTRVDFLN
jgi:hypothetical protein